MVSTSNEGIMSELLVRYAAIHRRPAARGAELLETLYLTDCYRAGADLAAARRTYDPAMWAGIDTDSIAARLDGLAHFMARFARERMALWDVAR